MSQGNGSQEACVLARMTPPASPGFTKVGIQLLVLNCLSVGHRGNFIFPLVFPQLE